MFAREYDPEYLNEILPPLPSENRGRAKPHQEPYKTEQEPPVLLNDHALKVWKGEECVLKEDGDIDRSGSLYAIGAELYKAGATKKTIAEALNERDVSLEWNKYTDRKNPEEQYRRIVDKLEVKAKNMDNVYDFDEHKKDKDGHPDQKSPFGNRVMLDDVMENGVEDPEELVKDVLLRGKAHHLYADAGSGKTFVAVCLAKEIVKQYKTVVYLDKENGIRTMAQRMGYLGTDPKQIREFLHYHFGFFALCNAETRTAYEDMLDQVKPDLIIFDSWIGFLTDVDLNENESRDIQRWASVYLHPARQRGITTLILDHVPHEAKRSRESGRKKEEVDVQWELHNSESFDRDKVGSIRLRRKKDREGWLPDTVTFRLGGADGEFIFEREQKEKEGDDLSDAQRKVLKILEDKFEGGAKNAEWMNACKKYENISESTYYDCKKKLTAKGRVEKRDEKFHPDYGSDDLDWWEW